MWALHVFDDRCLLIFDGGIRNPMPKARNLSKTPSSFFAKRARNFTPSGASNTPLPRQQPA